MQKTIAQPKIKFILDKTPREILQIWQKARGIWKWKKPEPITYLRKLRREWENQTP